MHTIHRKWSVLRLSLNQDQFAYNTYRSLNYERTGGGGRRVGSWSGEFVYFRVRLRST